VLVISVYLFYVILSAILRSPAVVNGVGRGSQGHMLQPLGGWVMGIAQTRGENLAGGGRSSVSVRTNIAFNPTKSTEIIVSRHIWWAQNAPKYFFWTWKAYSAPPDSAVGFGTALRQAESDIKLSKHITAAEYSSLHLTVSGGFATCGPSSCSGQQTTETFGKNISKSTQHYGFLGSDSTISNR